MWRQNWQDAEWQCLSASFVVHGSVWGEAPRNAIVSPNRIRLSRRAVDNQHTRVDRWDAPECKKKTHGYGVIQNLTALWLSSVLESVYLIWFLAGHNIQILLVGITSVETSSGSRYHAGKGIRWRLIQRITAHVKWNFCSICFRVGINKTISSVWSVHSVITPGSVEH